MPPNRSFTRRELAAAGALILAGAAIMVWIAFTSYGVRYDTDTASIVARLLASHPLHAYASVRYPYPGGFLPVLLLCRWVAQWTGAQFWALWKLPEAFSAAGVAVLLAWALGRLGATPRQRLATIALVSSGPIFLFVCGYHGQLDASAILPALGGVIVWQLGGERRALYAGLLVGLGAAIKTVPLFMVLAMLPTARSRREAVTLAASAVAVALASVLPFLVADPQHTLKSLTINNGVPGLGGLSVLVQPGLLDGWLHGRLPRVSSATWFFAHRQNLIVGAAVLAAGFYTWRRRMDAVSAAVLIWLVVYVANFNWAFQYWLWGIPFFLLAGLRKEVAALQALLLVPALELYLHFEVASLARFVLPLTLLTWCAIAVAMVAWGRKRHPRAPIALGSADYQTPLA